MIKAALEYLVGIGSTEIITGFERNYTSKPIHAVLDPTPDPLYVNTLTGFVDYFKGCGEDFEEENPVVLVETPAIVSLRSGLIGGFEQRKKFLVASCEAAPFRFGQFCPVEDFIISLQSQFVDGDDAAKILKVVGNLTDGTVHQFTDDGVSQGVTAKTGVAKVENVPLPRIVKLAPYRTFLEVDQPKSEFILRMRAGKDGAGPTCALFEADGGKWRLEAIKSVEKWIKKELPKATVLA